MENEYGVVCVKVLPDPYSDTNALMSLFDTQHERR